MFLIETEKEAVIAAVQSRIAVNLNFVALDDEDNTETESKETNITVNYDDILGNNLNNNQFELVLLLLG